MRRNVPPKRLFPRNHRHVVGYLLTHSVWTLNTVPSISYLGAFSKLWKPNTGFVMSLSACPHTKTRLPRNGFSWNLLLEYFFVKSFKKIHVLLKSDNLSACPHTKTRLPLKGFPWNLLLEYFFREIFQENPIFIKIWQSVRLSSYKNSTPTERIFMKFTTWVFFSWNLSRKSEFY